MTPASGERLVREQEKEGDLTPASPTDIRPRARKSSRMDSERSGNLASKITSCSTFMRGRVTWDHSARIKNSTHGFQLGAAVRIVPWVWRSQPPTLPPQPCPDGRRTAACLFRPTWFAVAPPRGSPW